MKFIRGLTRSQKRNLKNELVVLGHMVVLAIAAVLHLKEPWGQGWLGFAIVAVWLLINITLENRAKKRVYNPTH